MTKQSKWKSARNKGKFLFPVKAKSQVFRARFLAGLRKAFPEQPKAFFDQLFDRPRVYLRQTPLSTSEGSRGVPRTLHHKIAINNHRITSLDNGQATFRYKDYRKGAQKLQMSLPDHEFIRRFSHHILPKGFVRIRHYGFLSSCWKSEKLPHLQRMLGFIVTADNPPKPISHRKCSACGSGTLQTMNMFYGRAPPKAWLERIAQQQSSK